MEKYYTVEKHTQILIALLKSHGVRKIVVSPGATNVCLVGSLQQDTYFELYSSVDERSAAFLAVGLAAESGEPVALSCTGSTASRNYIPGLTEAFYRKLPVLAITSSQHLGRVGQNYAQVIDRSSPLADMVMASVTVDCVYTQEDEWECAVNVNKALIALRRDGGGPAHINLVTTYNRDFSCRNLPKVKAIGHISGFRDMPSLDGYRHIAILVGVHGVWPEELSDAVEDFCAAYDAVVVRNHASNYRGDYGYNPDLIGNMACYVPQTEPAELVIYIGSVSRYPSGMKGAVLWRVNPDGKIRDIEKNLTRVFAMEEADFFRYYADLGNRQKGHAGEKGIREGDARKTEDVRQENAGEGGGVSQGSAGKGRREIGYARQWQAEAAGILETVPELPFSNVWIAKTMSGLFPSNSVFHLAGSNTARAWNFFPIPSEVECYSNDGTMGIDGQVSALIGESLASPNRLHFGAVGDLTFFYDMNSLGNRHIGPNLRLLVVNNGKGAEFKIYSHPAYAFGEAGDAYMAAAGHYGSQSAALIRHYAEDLGYEYLTASTKEEFLEAVKRFTVPEMTEKPMIFEVFTESGKESEGIYIMNHLVSNTAGKAKSAAKDVIRSIAGEKGVSAVKKILKK